DDPNAPCDPKKCETERHCGPPANPDCMASRACDILAPGCRRQDGATRLCGEARVCTVPNPMGDPLPVATAGHDLGSTTFDPATVFTPAPEPKPTEFPADPPAGNGAEHSWCKYKPEKLAAQNADDTKEGSSGSGSFVSLKFDP